jgi:hypothetical protein
MKKRILIVIIALQGLFLNAGEYAGAFLEQGIGVRSLALGQAYSASAFDISAMYYNPAGISMIKSRQFGAQYTNMYQDLAYQHFIGYNHSLFAGLSVAAGWSRIGVENIDKTNNGTVTADILRDRAEETDYDLRLLMPLIGTFSNNNDVFYLSIAKNNLLQLDMGWQYLEVPIEIPVGLTFKYINQSLDIYSGSGIGFDLGTMLRFKLRDLLNYSWLGYFTYSFTVKDLFGTKIKWDTPTQPEDQIETYIFNGFTFNQPIDAIDSELNLMAMHSTKYDGEWHFGGEVVYDELIALRAGYWREEFTMGAGIKYWMFDLDYAFLPHDLGGSHRVAFLVNF